MLTFRNCLLSICLICASSCLAQEPSLDNLLDELDRTIDMRSEIIANKESKIQSLKLLRDNAAPSTRLELTETIFNEYSDFRTDSALLYAKEYLLQASNPQFGSPLRKQRAEIELAKCYSIYGEYGLAEKKLAEVYPDLMNENKSLYYNTLVLLYIWRADYTRHSETRKNYYSHVVAFRDSVYKYETDPVLRLQQHSLILLENDEVSAKNELRGVMPKIKGKGEYIRYISNSLASCYKRLGIADSARYYYAMSALSDLQMGVQEHSSLRELALLLFEDGDVTRAYKYTNCCLEDAQACGAQLRMMQMAADMPRIMETYQTLVEKQKKRLRIGIALLVLSIFLLTCATVYFYRITKKMHRARHQLLTVNSELNDSRAQLETSLAQTRLANDHLQQANNVKESFVAQYMKQCMQSLELLESYRHQILKLAMGGANINKVVMALRDNSMAEKEQKKFLQNFDESFLRLFPTFIEEFNSLLQPEDRIVLPEGKLMNTELRIYALVRLGITESEEIGDFIGKSVKTVYNYRARIRNKAIGNRDDFDDDVQKLCLV